MKAIKVFKEVKVRVYVTLGNGVYINLSGRGQKILKDVATHHLPIHKIEKQLVASGKMSISVIKSIIAKLKSGSTNNHTWGDSVQIFIHP